MNSKTILFDPGHGGYDPGASFSVFHEDDLNLDFAIALGLALRRRGFIVLYTRDTDTYLSPGDRLRIIREAKPDAAISIHYNATDNPAAHGGEIYYRDEYDLPLANALASALQHSELGCKKPFQDIARLNRRLAVLNDLKTCAVLLELGYLTNKNDREKIVEQRDSLAELLASSIAAYYEGIENDQK
jgi:N-acetylmuramoyl-L-alanine amidase